jgi:carbonic anhydrase
MHLKKALLFLLLFLVALKTAEAQMRPVGKIRAGLPPFSVAETLARHNDQVVTSTRGTETNQQPATTPHMTWLADCDARVQTTLFYPDPVAKIHAVRNMGNQLMLSAGAVDYGINELHTPVLLITGNTDNASIRIFRKGYSHLGLEMRRTLDHLHLPLKGFTAESAGKDGVDGQGDVLLVEKNIDFQVKEAGKRYEQRLHNGRLVVIGAVLDLDNQYGFGQDRLVLININGETDPGKLRAMPHLARLDKNLLAMVGRPVRPEGKSGQPPATKAPAAAKK